MISKRMLNFKPKPLKDTIKFRYIRGDYEKILNKNHARAGYGRYWFVAYIQRLLIFFGAIEGQHYRIEYGRNCRGREIIQDFVLTNELHKRIVKLMRQSVEDD